MMYIPHHVKNILRLALEEDIGHSDITTALLIPDRERAKALLVAKGSFIVAGMPFAQEVFALVDPQTQFRIYFCDGSRTAKGDIIAEIAGNTRTLLSCERVAL